MSKTQVPLWTSFGRSQIASFTATAVDFCMMVLLVELFHIWYVAATAMGASCGAITSFMMGRHWSFEAHQGAVRSQAVKYALVSGASLFLNSLGVYLFTDLIGFKYTISRVITALLVGVCFNFPLHRSFVFR